MSGGKGSNNLSIGKLGCSKIVPRLFQDCSKVVLSITQREDSEKKLCQSLFKTLAKQCYLFLFYKKVPLLSGSRVDERISFRSFSISALVAPNSRIASSICSSSAMISV